ncbi:MAG: SGNH/GDSL hydrolase family protein [Defluviitaleaceae bacterium]|nr:SGNH/GDSL hydrolase family protein [Defluviitaleaceae bacterium]
MVKFFVLLCAIVIFTSCGSRRDNRDVQDVREHEPNDIEIVFEETPAPDPIIERKVYIALGDSVSEGFGIWSLADRHTSVFFEMLREQGFANEYVNLAVNGYTTADLLSLLNSLSPGELSNFQYARVITLNIGGNNILAPLWEHLPDADSLQGIISETTDFIREAFGLMGEIMDFVSESREPIANILDFANEVIYFAENFGVRDIFRLNDMIAAAPPVIDGAMEVFAEVDAMEATVTEMLGRTSELEILGLFALFSGELPPSMERDLHAGVRIFTREFIEILEWLEDNAPYATVIVNTVYNPLPSDLLGMSFGLSDESERFIQSLNRVILMESQSRGFIVSDIYGSLSNRPDMMNANFDIIHPNPQGHYEIAKINFSDFMRY